MKSKDFYYGSSNKYLGIQYYFFLIFYFFGRKHSMLQFHSIRNKLGYILRQPEEKEKRQDKKIRDKSIRAHESNQE